MVDALTCMCVGMCSLDELLLVNQPVGSDGKQVARECHRSCGGMAANVATTLSRLGLRAGLVTAIGPDSTGRALKNDLDRAGVHIFPHLQGEAETNQTRIVVVAGSGVRHAIALPFLPLRRISEDAFDAMDGARALYLDGTSDPSVERDLLRAGLRRGIPVFYNLETGDEQRVGFFREATHGVLDQATAKMLARGADYDDMLKHFHGGSGWKALTLGADGSVLYDGYRYHRASGLAVQCVDATGAGDAFLAGLIYGTMRKGESVAQIRFATRLGAEACCNFGGQIPSTRLDKVLREVESCRRFGGGTCES